MGRSLVLSRKKFISGKISFWFMYDFICYLKRTHIFDAFRIATAAVVYSKKMYNFLIKSHCEVSSSV